MEYWPVPQRAQVAGAVIATPVEKVPAPQRRQEALLGAPLPVQ